MTFRLAVALFALAAMVAGPRDASAAVAPRLAIASLSDLAVPRQPYSADANAEADVAQGIVQARAEHKRLLIDLGGNWCADCRILSGVMQLPAMQSFLDAHFVVVLVDVGRFDRNSEIPARFGINDRLEGVPSILIVDPDGQLLDRGQTAALVGAGGMDPQSIANWFARWAE